MAAEAREDLPDDQAIRLRIKRLIVDRLLMQKLTVEGIGDHDALFGGGVGLDSIDGLELVLGLEQEFGIKIKNKAIQRESFASVATLADYIKTRLPGSAAVES